MSLASELKRRNVIRVATAYVVVTWLLIQVAETIFPLFGFDDAPARIVVIVLAIGFVPAIALAWVFEITPEGLKRDADAVVNPSRSRATGKKLDRAIFILLGLSVSYFAFDKFVLDPARDQSIIETARQEGRADALIKSYGDKSIAVLPFVDMSAEKDQEYMSDGIAEELLNLLARYPQLRVISRSSSFAFKGKDFDIPSVAQKLNVAYVLEGSVRTAGQQLRITAQLIDARTDTHLWSETYDRTLENIFQVQDEISAAIIASLEVQLLHGDEASAGTNRSVNADAYNAYLIGIERMALRTQVDIDAARAQFEKAIEIDDRFAPAHVQLAHTWLLLEQYIYGGDPLNIGEADEVIATHLARAQELAPDLPEVFGVQGYFHLRRHRYEEARSALDRALKLSPNYALAYNWRATTAYDQNRFLDMLADREKAYSLDPMSLQISLDLASDYRNFWRPNDAERVINRMFDRHPDHPLAYRAAAFNLGMHGRHGEAQLMQEKAFAANPDNDQIRRGLVLGLYYMGLFEDVEKLNSANYSFFASMVEGRYDDAKARLDKQKEGNPRTWRSNARKFYRVTGDEQRLGTLSEIVDDTIASLDVRNVPWREYCDVNLIFDLQQIGSHKDAVDSMLAACHDEFEERVKANYLCPCELQMLVHYTILDKRFDEAIDRAQQWLDSGWSSIDLPVDPIFKLLSDRPEYPQLLARNFEQIERQKQIYLAGKNMQ